MMTIFLRTIVKLHSQMRIWKPVTLCSSEKHLCISITKTQYAENILIHKELLV